MASKAQVECVARAIYAAYVRYWKVLGSDAEPWDDGAREWRKREARVAARAAIKALQKPKRGKPCKSPKSA